LTPPLLTLRPYHLCWTPPLLTWQLLISST
jgi:hypothetical protein